MLDLQPHLATSLGASCVCGQPPLSLTHPAGEHLLFSFLLPLFPIVLLSWEVVLRSSFSSLAALYPTHTHTSKLAHTFTRAHVHTELLYTHTHTHVTDRHCFAHTRRSRASIIRTCFFDERHPPLRNMPCRPPGTVDLNVSCNGNGRIIFECLAGHTTKCCDQCFAVLASTGLRAITSAKSGTRGAKRR